MNLVCLFRLHWMFDHAIGYNEDRTQWTCKACHRELGPTGEARVTLVNRFDE